MDYDVCVVGTGYVGMACSVGMARLGWNVIGYDILPERIEKLKRAVAPYHENGIDELLRENIDAGRLQFTSDIAQAVGGASTIIVAVGTPSRDDGSCDLSALYECFAQMKNVKLSGRPSIVIRSTVPPGTSDDLANAASAWADVVYAPEFLREGSAVPDFLNPDRIVVGSDDAAVAERYAVLLKALDKPVIVTSRRNAELIKGCSNAFLALKISFANEVANLCDAVGGMADEVLSGIGADQRIGGDFLKAGIGFGGPCFEKDVKSMRYVSEQHGVGNQLFDATLRINEAQPKRVVRKLEAALGSRNLEGRQIGVWGLTFKAGTSDVRDSLAVRIVDALAARGASVKIYDPAVHLAHLPPRCRLVTSALEAAECDALVALTAWPEFLAVDPREVASRVATGVVIDGCNGLDPSVYSAAGLRYDGVGRAVSGVARSAGDFTEEAI